MTGEAWIQLGAFITQIGFAAFVAYWLLTRSLPENQKLFTSSLVTQQERYSADMTLQRGDFLRALQEERDDFKIVLQREAQNQARVMELITGQNQTAIATIMEQMQQSAQRLIELHSITKNNNDILRALSEYIAKRDDNHGKAKERERV